MDKKPLFISTAIPYVNAKPHIGFALEVVQADIVARYARVSGRDVYFLSGTDDNSIKNVQSAEKEGKEVNVYVGEMAETFNKLLKGLNISNDDFIKTSTDKRHFAGARKLWESCKKEDIYKKSYKGLYCDGCEEFKTEKDLINGECPEHPLKKLEVVEEENYFFNLSNYQEKLTSLIESGEFQIIPETRKNETLSFIKGGLEDFSISRSNKRAKNWGISVPNDDTQMMYVWFDALSNYINALGYSENAENFQKFWNNAETIHWIGKGINRFHTVYWPAMLLSAGVTLPKKVVIHGYITVGGQKMSKSIGNVIDPMPLIEEYGTDAVRYVLAKIPVFEDGDITLERIKDVYNADLANGIGNLLSRVIKMSSMYGIKNVSTKVTQAELVFEKSIEAFDIKLAIDLIWHRVMHTDQFIQREEPFKKIKINPEEAKANISFILNELWNIAEQLKPFMPKTSEKIIECIEKNKMPEVPLFPRKD